MYEEDVKHHASMILEIKHILEISYDFVERQIQKKKDLIYEMRLIWETNACNE